MNKRKQTYIDNAFLVLIGLLIVNTVIRYIQNNFVLSLNNYLGAICWAVSVIVALFKSRWKTTFVFLLLTLSTVNILNFTIETIYARIATDGNDFHGFSLNPISFLLLIIYLVLSWKVVQPMLTKWFFKNDEELRSEQNLKVNFYYEKFNNYGAEEFGTVLKSYEQYPAEAQVAIKKIQNERSNRIN